MRILSFLSILCLNWTREGLTSSRGCIKSIIVVFFFLLPSNPSLLEGSRTLVTYTKCLLMVNRKESGLSNKHAPNFQLIGSLGSNSSSDYCKAVMEQNSKVICKSSYCISLCFKIPAFTANARNSL